MPPSRLQLAAALIEYDNDDEDVDGFQNDRRRDHRASAIFLPFQQAEQAERRRQILSQPPPVIPSPIEPTFARSETPQGELDKVVDNGEEEDIGELDVARWDLPDHLVASEPKARSKPPVTRRVSAQPVPQPVTSPHERVQSMYVSDILEDADAGVIRRSEDWGGERDRRVSMDQYGAGKALAQAERVRRLVERPHTVMGWQDGGRPELRDRRISNPIMIPLPSSPISPAGGRSLSSLSRAYDAPYPEDEEVLDELPNPFALPAPGPESGSRFDPKNLAEQRRSSISSLSRPAPVASRPGSRMSLAIDTQPRRTSTELSFRDSPGPVSPPLASPTQVYDKIPTAKQYGRPLMPQRYSTSAMRVNRQSLLRPNVLVMPAPLTGVEPPSKRMSKVPEGFIRGDKPLPAEARVQGARPGLPLSLSQRTFRSSLLVGGRHEDPEYWVGGAEEDGELGVSKRELDPDVIERKAGKLYGRSLIDELEARKATMKGKQRMFTGDSRPAMMSRSSMYLDASSFSLPSSAPTSPNEVGGGGGGGSRPATFHPGNRQSSLQRRSTLLRFDSSDNIQASQLAPPDHLEGGPAAGGADRLSKTKSVFGVDQVWERELVKLNAMKAAEEQARQEEEARKAIAEGKKKGKKWKGKGKEKEVPQDAYAYEPVAAVTREATPEPGVEEAGVVDAGPPRLEWSPEKAPKKVEKDAEDEDGQPHEGQLVETDDQQLGIGGSRPAGLESDDDSEDDVPISQLVRSSSAHSRLTSRLAAPSIHSLSIRAPSIISPARNSGAQSDSDSDSEENIPLSQLALRPTTRSAGSADLLGLAIPSGDLALGEGGDVEVDEDDLPLAVRQAHAKGLPPPTRAEMIEDDLPLGYKHAEAAQRQMAQRSVSTGWNEGGRSTMMSYGPGMGMGMDMSGGMGIGMGGYGMGQMPYGQQSMWGMPNMGMGMGMGGMGGMGMMGPGMQQPYNGLGMGFPTMSMPNLNQGMGMGMMSQEDMGGMGGEGMGAAPSPGANIDHWRKEVPPAVAGP